MESRVGEGTTFCVELEGECADGMDSDVSEETDAGILEPGADTLLAGRRFLIAEGYAINCGDYQRASPHVRCGAGSQAKLAPRR